MELNTHVLHQVVTLEEERHQIFKIIEKEFRMNDGQMNNVIECGYTIKMVDGCGMNLEANQTSEHTL